MAPTNTRKWDNIQISVDGKTVKLEDAFEVFEDIFDDAEEAFKHMENAFRSVDKDIHEKVDILRKKLAEDRPDEYEYISDEVDRRFKKSRRNRNNIHRLIIAFTITTLLIFAGLFYMAITLESEQDAGNIKTLEPTKTYEELEKL